MPTASTDLSLPDLIEYFRATNKIACFVGVEPTASFHVASVEPDGVVREIEHIAKSGSVVNGGFFVFRREIFDYIQEGEELVDQPFHRLIAERQLVTYPYDGFWACMDTFKEKQQLDELYSRGNAPWEVWHTSSSNAAAGGCMFQVSLGGVKNVLCVGAHSDDIEIGCGGTLLKLALENHALSVMWVVFSAEGRRSREARLSARLFLKGSPERRSQSRTSREASSRVTELGSRESSSNSRRFARSGVHALPRRPPSGPRVLSDLAWNTFRDHLILEYEIPKYDGDLGFPNFVRAARRRSLPHEGRPPVQDVSDPRQ